MQSMHNINVQKNTNKSGKNPAHFGASSVSQTKVTLTRIFLLASVFGLAWLVTAL